MKGFQANGIGNIDYVVLAGGMAKMPLVADFFVGKGVDRNQIHIAGGNLRNPNEAISLGLAEDIEPEKLNLARPSYDLVLKWQDDLSGQSGVEKIYAAYSPLYESINVNGYPCFRLDSIAEIPSGATVDLRVVDPRNNQELDFRNKDTRETKEVYFWGRDFRHLVLYPSGYMVVQHAGTEQFRIASWPFGRFNQFVDIEVKEKYEPYEPVPMDDLR
jgi:hypothetical protein